MNTYLVHLKAVPSRGAQEFGQVGGAHVHLYVKSGSISEAAQQAVALVMSRSWVVSEQPESLLMTPERIALMDEIESAAYRRAQADGIYAYFVAWPIEDRDDDLIEIRSLKDQDKSSDTEH